MIRSLQEKYLSLEKKEQRYLQVCGVAILLFIIYQFIFTPYQASMAKIDNQLSYQSKLNIWLRSVEPKLKQLHENAKKINVSKSSLLSITSSSLKQSILKSYQHELQQSDNEIIQLTFKSVPYVEFIAWLEKFCLHYQINIKDLNLNYINKPGLVSMSLRFEIIS